MISKVAGWNRGDSPVKWQFSCWENDEPINVPLDLGGAIFSDKPQFQVFEANLFMESIGSMNFRNNCMMQEIIQKPAWFDSSKRVSNLLIGN